MTGCVSLGILGRSVSGGSHICAFYTGPAARDEILLPFLTEGLRTGQKCLCILDSLAPADVMARLGDQVDASHSVETGQFELIAPADAYLRSGRFCTEEMLGYWTEAVGAAQGTGQFSFIRATGEMPSILDNPAGRTEFFRYEALLNEFVPRFPQVVILCLYDLARFGAEVLMDTLRTHAMVIVDGVVHDNPYYIEPGAFLVPAGLTNDGQLVQ